MPATPRAAVPTHRTLGRTGLNVSIVGYGAEPLGRKDRSFEDADRTLQAIVNAGINLIDTASAYGNSEKFIGRSLNQRHRDDEVTFITKCGWTGDWEPAWKPAELAATIDQSLRDLHVDCLDILLLHSCPLEDLKQGDVIKAVQAAQSQGKSRFIGYSGDNEALRFAVESDLFDVIETSFNILDQANAPAIAEAHRRGVGIVIKRPIANAVPGRTERPRSDYAAQYWPRWQEIGLTDADIDHLPWLEAAMRFTAYWPGVGSALIGSSHAEHMVANIADAIKGPLDPTIMQRLTDAFAKTGSAWPALG